MARQKPTNPDIPDWTLTPQQETAVDLLASGKTVTDTATAVAVTRQTVLPAAVHVLKACGLYGMVIPLGPTEVDDIDLAQRRRVYERKLASLEVGTDEDLDIAQRRRAYERVLTGLAAGPV